MGRVLIIKDADFSQVAVAHENVEPSVFYNVGEHIGPSGYGGYNNGDFYFRCQHGINNQVATLTVDSNCGLFQKVNNNAVRPDDIAAGKIIKINGCYYSITADTPIGVYIEPYYNVFKPTYTIELDYAYKFVDGSTVPNDVQNSVYGRTQIQLTAGKKYVFFGVGSPSSLYTIAIVKKADGTYVNLGDGPVVNFIEYTAESSEEIVYLSGNRSFPLWAAEVG